MRISDWSSDVCSSDLFAIIERDRGMSFAIPAHDRIACGRNAGLAGKNADADLERTVADLQYAHADAQVRRIRHFAPIIDFEAGDDGLPPVVQFEHADREIGRAHV